MHRISVRSFTWIALAIASGALASRLVSAGSRSSTGGSETVVSSPQSAEEDLRAGKEAESHGDLDLARRHFAKAISIDPFATEALERFAEVSVARAWSMLSYDDHNGALLVLASARERMTFVNSQLAQSDESLRGFPVVARVEKRLRQADEELRMDAERKACTHVQRANQFAEQAHHGWYTFRSNDRDGVREALRELHYVHERFGIISVWLRGEYYRVANRSKELVSDKEWDGLMASGGFLSHEKP